MFRWHRLGSAQRRPLEGPAALVPVVSDLLAAVRRVDGCRGVGEGLAPARAKARCAGRDRLGGVVCRRHVLVCEKRGDLVGKTKRGKGTKLMVLADGRGLPLAVDIASASPAEVTLIEPLLDQAVTRYVPNRLIYDRAADSDPLRERLRRRAIELICPHRRGRVRKATQDGRRLRRYRRRWKIERSISWLHAFRRLVTRYEFYSFLFHGFAKLACLIVVLRRF